MGSRQPEYPQERLAFMLEDASVRVVLTQQSLVQRLPKHSAFVIRLDADWESIEKQSAQNPENAATPDNAAYVIYTSGSTGRPKAVVMPHRGAVNLINYQIQSSGPEKRLRTLQFASLSFDVSFQEIFPTLCAGGSLVILKTTYDESIKTISPAFLMREESFRGLFEEGRIEPQHVIEDAPTVIRSVKSVGFPTLAVASSYPEMKLTDANWIVKSLRSELVAKEIPQLRLNDEPL